MGSPWIDISLELRSGMIHWPGDPPVRIKRAQSIRSGDEANLSRLELGSHSGTHVDAPLHFLPGGEAVDHLPLERMRVAARVLEIADPHRIQVSELEGKAIHPGESLLFKTLNSTCDWPKLPFNPTAVHLDRLAAEFLARKRPLWVGIDALSIGGYQGEGKAVHKTLLAAGIWILEGLQLSEASEGDYELFCFPLKIRNGDGAPARALLRKIETTTLKGDAHEGFHSP